MDYKKKYLKYKKKYLNAKKIYGGSQPPPKKLKVQEEVEGGPLVEYKDNLNKEISITVLSEQYYIFDHDNSEIIIKEKGEEGEDEVVSKHILKEGTRIQEIPDAQEGNKIKEVVNLKPVVLFTLGNPLTIKDFPLNKRKEITFFKDETMKEIEKWKKKQDNLVIGDTITSGGNNIGTMGIYMIVQGEPDEDDDDKILLQIGDSRGKIDYTTAEYKEFKEIYNKPQEF
jgi:hypothetical protein